MTTPLTRTLSRTLSRTLTHLAAGLLAATTLAASSWAGPVSARLTARDVYWAYTGAADGSSLALLGGDHQYNTAENYSTNAAAGDYLYVVAWTHVGQEDQAFQGTVTSTLGTAPTNASPWQAITRPSPFVGFAALGTPAGHAELPLGLLMADIAGASWQAPQAVSSPLAWGDVVGGGQAQWIWADSFNPNPLGSYAIFRTALEPALTNNNVPEPGSLALALLALGALRGLGAGRRSAKPAG